MNNTHIAAIFVIALILIISSFSIGFMTGYEVSPEPVLRDICQHQEYLNYLRALDPDPPFPALVVDGKMGEKTVQVWEWYSANYYGVVK